MRRRGCQRRSGVVLVAALVCLLIVTSIVGSMLQSALRARRQLHAERDRRQTELLLAAGASRAAARLASDAEFLGDAWTLPADDIVGLGAGRVTTEISRNNNQAWQLHVVAEYPIGRDLPIRRSQTFQIPSPSAQTQE
jgi:type II secretory pathway component PulK